MFYHHSFLRVCSFSTKLKQEAQLMLTTGSTRLLAVSRARAICDGTLT